MIAWRRGRVPGGPAFLPDAEHISARAPVPGPSGDRRRPRGDERKAMTRDWRTVALLGDTHGFLDPRIERLALGCDLVVHTGDVGGRSVLDRLTGPAGAPVVVAGNNDTRRHWAGDGEAAVDDLPAEARVDLRGGRLLVVHGHRLRARGRHRRLRRMYPDSAAIVYGHSHRACVDRDEVPWVLNPGAAGRSRTCGGPACLVLRADAAGWRTEVRRFAPLPRGS